MGKDPDGLLHDISRSKEERKQLLRKCLEDSVPALDYLVQTVVLPEMNAMVRGQKLRALVEILSLVPDEIERTMLKKGSGQAF